jgi:RNA polymerase subunit RPABC4/transcription elongation factor Spt4
MSMTARRTETSTVGPPSLLRRWVGFVLITDATSARSAKC